MAIFKISYKLMAAFLIILLFSGGIGYYIQVTENHVRETVNKQAAIMADSERLAKYNLELFSFAESYLLHNSEIERDRIKSRFSDSYGKLSGKVEALRNEGIDPYMLDMIKKYSEETKSNFEELAAIHDARLLSNNSSVTAEMEARERMALKLIEDKESKIIGARDMIVGAAQLNLENAINEAEQKEQLSGNLLIGVLFLGLAMGIFLTHTITKQITTLRNGVKKVGSGDLNIKLDASSHDELGEVAAAFNKMTEDLKKSTVSMKEMDEIVRKRTTEAEAKNEELERFNKLSVGRELKMIELKKRITSLEEALSKKSSRQRISSS